MVTSVVNGLHNRAALTARLLSERMPSPAWAGYHESEHLLGRLTRPASFGGAPTVEFWREGNPDASITMAFLRMIDVTEEEKLEPVITRAGITEREAFEVDFKHEIEYEETVTHEFEKTTSFNEAAEKAWEAGAKASLSIKYAGIGGSVEAYGKYGETLKSNQGGGTRELDRVSKVLRFRGPAKFVLEAFRSRNRMSQTVRVRADFDAKIFWTTGNSDESGLARQWEFTTFRSQFLPLAEGLLSDDVYGYREFMAAPVSAGDIAGLKARSDDIIEFTAEFDEVTTRTLREI